MAQGFDGRVGVCVSESTDVVCINGNRRFPLQSVMKLLVALAVMDSVDHGGLRLEDAVLVRREDLAPGSADRRARHGCGIQHDSRRPDAASHRRQRQRGDRHPGETLGGPARSRQSSIGFTLPASGSIAMRRHLQTETRGLEWRQEYVDAALLEKAFAGVPPAQTDAAFRAYQKDPRDTATPLGMVSFLQSLADGRLLSANSTRHLLEVMGQTVTFPDRLKAGVPAGWTLAHKTGTSGDWHGVTAATNDVGVLRAPDGRYVSVAVCSADSRATAKDRAALMANVARVTIQSHR